MSKKDEEDPSDSYKIIDKTNWSSEEQRRKRKARKEEEEKRSQKPKIKKPISLNTSDLSVLKKKVEDYEFEKKKKKEDIKKPSKSDSEIEKKKSIDLSDDLQTEVDKNKKRKSIEENRLAAVNNGKEKEVIGQKDSKQKLDEEELKKKRSEEKILKKKISNEQALKKKSTDQMDQKKEKSKDELNSEPYERHQVKSDMDLKDDNFNYLYQFDQLTLPNKPSLSSVVKSDSNKQLSNLATKSAAELKDAKSMDALEQIKNKLEEQKHLKQDRSSAYKQNINQQQTRISKSSIGKLEKESDNMMKIIAKESPLETHKESTKEKLKTKSLGDLNAKEKRKDLRKIKSDQNVPKLKIDKDKKEINIKANQSLKANLSIGKEIKAQFDNKTPVKEKPKSNKENEDENDWSSISIQLDIVKDPKTKKIEINEDVKVLSPTSLIEKAKVDSKIENNAEPKVGQEVESKIQSKVDRKIELKPEPKVDAKIERKKIEPIEQKVEQTMEPDKKLEEQIRNDEENLEKQKAELLKSKPSITHYVTKKDAKNEKSKRTKEDTDKFTRFYTSSETESSKSTEERRSGIKKNDPKSKQSTEQLERLQKLTQAKPDQNIEQQAVVIFKADADGEKTNSSKDSSRNLKRMDIFKIDSKKSEKKKPIDDSSSDEQTYEQIINKRNETLKLHLPTLNHSSPSFQPTPQPFHLKVSANRKDLSDQSDSKASKDLKESDKSEEMTYHEQKRRFSLKADRRAQQKEYLNNYEKSIETSSSQEEELKNKLKTGKDYENIKKLDIPSEKKTELEKEFIENRLNDLKLKQNRQKDEIRTKQIEVRMDKKERKIQVDEPNEQDQLNENIILVNKFNNEVERLRRLERYLVKMKLILSNETSEIDIKRRIMKRLILIKKDLNKLIRICDQLMDSKYLNKKRINKLAIRNSEPSLEYSDGSDEESLKSRTKRDRTKWKTKRLKEEIREELKKELKDELDNEFKKKFKAKIREEDYEESRNDRKCKSEQVKKKRKEINEDIKKDEKFKSEKVDDKNLSSSSSLRSRTILNRISQSSTFFKLFLLLLIIITVLFSYCYYKRNKMSKRFPCRLKRKT